MFTAIGGIGGTIFSAVTIVGGIIGLILWFRAYTNMNAYLLRFRPEIDFFADGPHYADRRQVLYQPQPDAEQPDAELESLRGEMWRRYRFVRIWGDA